MWDKLAKPVASVAWWLLERSPHEAARGHTRPTEAARGHTRPTEATASVPTEDWLITLYVGVDTWWQREGRWVVPARPGPTPTPTCSDVELLTLALAREFLERRSERAWRAEGLADWP